MFRKKAVKKETPKKVSQTPIAPTPEEPHVRRIDKIGGRRHT